MHTTRFDALTRQVRAIDRKTSLKVLGGSLAAVAAARPGASAAKKSCGEKCDKKCGKVEKGCKAHWNEECPTQECRDNFHACCAHLGRCKGTQYFDCVSQLAM
ncbi:MAG: hypothetical protein ACRDJC_11995 [Thermomicrobiales bacterium]